MAKPKKKTSTESEAAESTALAVIDPQSETVDPVHMMRQQLAEEQAETDQFDGEAWEQYLSLIAVENPTQQQALDLIESARDLELSPEDVEADRQTIRRALELQRQHDEAATLHQKFIDAREAYKAFLERIDLEETVLSERREHADRQYQSAVQAGRDNGGLQSLARTRPDLFDFSQHPPRLRSEIVTK